MASCGFCNKMGCSYTCICSVLVVFYYLFHLLGNTVENVNGKSAFVWMVARWNDTQSVWCRLFHGYLIPFVSACCFMA